VPAKSGNRVLIIVLCVLGGILLIIGGCVTTCAYFVHKKAQEYVGEAQQNPQVAAMAFAASLNPNLQVVSKNAAAGKITIKNKQTGEVVTLDLSAKNVEAMRKTMEQFANGLKVPPPSEARTEASEPAVAPAVVEDQPAPVRPPEKKVSPAQAALQVAPTGKIPDFIVVYPGAETLENNVNSYGKSSIGNYTFSTSDEPGVVADFYEKRFTDAGLSIVTRQTGSDGGGATSSMIANRADPQAMVTFTAKIEDGRTRVVVGFTAAIGK
jgi:hypothetical protein